MDAIKQMEEFYKKLLEEEITDICDKVLDEIIVKYAFEKFIPMDTFIEKGVDYIQKNDIPVDSSIISEYIKKKTKEKGLREIKGGNIYKRISGKWNNVCFNKFSPIVKSENEERTRLIYCLENFFLFYKLRKVTLYTEFSELKNIFEYMGMGLSGQLSVLIETIKLNYSCFNNPDFVVYLPNNEAILNHKFKNIKHSEIAEMIANYKLEEFLANEDPKLEAAQDELLEFMESTSIDVTGVQEASLSLGTIITNEKISSEDEEVIMVCLQKLSFEHLYYRFIKYFNQIDNNKSLVVDIVDECKKEEIKKEPKFKTRKINQVHYEINKLYDLENFKSRTTLSLDEIIYILSLMYSIEMDESIISHFLKSVSHEYKKNNPFAIYYQSKEKYEASDNEEVSAHLEMIEYILSDFDIFSCSDEKYTETKSMISEEITAISQILEGNYTYEIDKAKMLLKGNGGE